VLSFVSYSYGAHRDLHSFPTRRSSDLFRPLGRRGGMLVGLAIAGLVSNYVLYLMGLNLLSPGTTQLVIQIAPFLLLISSLFVFRSEEHTSELQSRENLVCRLLLEKKKK